MGFLVFSYCLAAFLFALSYYLDSRAEKASTVFTSLTMMSAFSTLLLVLSMHLRATGNTTISNLSLRLALVCVATVVLTVLRYTYSIPYNSKSAILTVFNWLLIIFSAFLVFSLKFRFPSKTRYLCFSELVVEPVGLGAVQFMFPDRYTGFYSFRSDNASALDEKPHLPAAASPCSSFHHCRFPCFVCSVRAFRQVYLDTHAGTVRPCRSSGEHLSSSPGYYLA